MASLSKLFRNLAHMARRPRLGAEYAGWLLSAARHGGSPTRRLLGGIEIGGFANFSEYHSVPRFINEEERRFFEEAPIGPGALIDVGANVGLVSLLLARRFPDREIHAFEPNPTTFSTLTENIARNRAKRVACHQSAVSDTDGEVLFDSDPIKRGTASIAVTNGDNATRVAATTLDRFVAAHGVTAIGLLKIDVEGFETLVLRGATQVLERIRPTLIYFEVCPILTHRAGFAPTEPARLLLDAGYTLTRLDGTGTPSAASLEDVADVQLENWIAAAR